MTLSSLRNVPTYFLPKHLGAEPLAGAPGELWLRVTPLSFERTCHLLSRAGARFITLLATDGGRDEREPTAHGKHERGLVAALALRGHLLAVHAPRPAAEPVRYGSLGAWWPAARWAEQELVERGLAAPVGYAASRPLARPDASRLERRVEGLDVFAIPYGPVRSGIFEAIQFQIETGGENVLAVTTRPYFKHRGLERRFAGLDPDRAVHVAERIAGTASVAYACAFAQAVERALGVEPPPAAQRWRALHAELERLASHLDVIAKEAETAALYVAQARFQILKEQVMRLRAELCGSRFGRGLVVPGGVRAAGGIGPEPLLRALDLLEAEFERDSRRLLATASMTDRLLGAGRLDRELVERHCAVGPVARGSGLSIDARHERPYGEYRRVGVRVICERAGDAMARVNVRLREIRESLRIARATLDRLRRGEAALCAPLPDRASGAAFGWAEAPAGEVVVWAELREGVLANVHIASPSLRNWALFEHAFGDDVLTDFAFIEHSFGLTPAGADR